MPILNSYQDVLDYMFQKLPMYQREGASAYKKDLTNTLALCKMVGNPQEKLKCIHIAGTNGKGTTSHIIAAGLQAQGYKTGVYTSPHYKDFRERIKINGVYIDVKYLKWFINTYQAQIETIQPSFFEITVVLAFSWFAEQQVDYAIIETGLGGRLDSTNVITPLLSIITNISFDHQSMLGNTLQEIAAEKAGIIKHKVPIIIGETQEEVVPIFKAKSELMEAPIYFADQVLSATIVDDKSNLTFQMFLHGQPWNGHLKTSLAGTFQSKNIVTALFALQLLVESAVPIDMAKVWAFLSEMSAKTKYLGRWQTLNTKPLTITDSAHNEGGLRLVMEQLQKIPCKHKHIVLGFVNDKTLDDILTFFPKDGIYYWAKANVPRGLDAAILASKGKSFGLYGNSYTSVRKAYAAARKKANTEDLIYIGGSIFVVAEVI
ncbi:MAG: bifunctional folylpolyglutamate synthase/dihydrofolate synthase [Chitinophagales bacterium]|nr:bifunctional folylpolyglutamate synthase/dihydrofolate synthase [Chitinophagales bacterium]